jgi:hypothetical protein
LSLGIQKKRPSGFAPQQLHALLGFDLNIENLIFIKSMRSLTSKIPKLAFKSFGPDGKNGNRAED